MLKKILITSLTTFTLLMSGCGDVSEGESRLETQQMLDNSNFDGVINKLATKVSNTEEYISLASAYMGRAGFSLSNVVRALAESEDIGNGDAFIVYTKNISDMSSQSAFLDLQKATVNYTKIVNNRCLEPLNLTGSEKEVCLYLGLALTTNASVTLDLITDDITSLANDIGTDSKLKASSCALEYSYNRNSVDEDCSVSTLSSIRFIESEKDYERITISVNSSSENYDFLLSDQKVILTKGYCSLDDFTTRQKSSSPALYPCPLNEEKNSQEITTESILVDTLNNGLAVASSVAPEEMQGDIDRFKCDVLGGVYTGNECSENGEITAQIVINFLNTQNR